MGDKLRPTEDRLLELREELGKVTEETKILLSQRIRDQVALREGELDLQQVTQACYDQELSSAKLASDLRERNREVQERIASTTEVLRTTTESADNTTADNE